VTTSGGEPCPRSEAAASDRRIRGRGETQALMPWPCSTTRRGRHMIRLLSSRRRGCPSPVGRLNPSWPPTSVAHRGACLTRYGLTSRHPTNAAFRPGRDFPPQIPPERPGPACGFIAEVLVYAASLEMNRRGSPAEPAPLEEIAEVVATWAGIGSGWATADNEGRRGARVHTELLGPDDRGLRGWRLQLSHPDPRDQGFLWTVTVTALQDVKTEVGVRLDRTRIASALGLPRETPAPPGCIPALLDAATVEARDGGRTMTTNVWVVGETEAAELAALVRSRTRRLPIVGFTPRDDDAVDGGVLLGRIVGIAHVALIRSATTWQLDGLLPPGFNVYGGAVRIWWPGITPSSDRWDHKLWPADVSARRLSNEVVEMVAQASLAAARVDPRTVRLERLTRDRELKALRDEIAELRGRYAQSTAAQDGLADATEARIRLEEAENALAAKLTAERDEAESLAEAYARENDELRVRAGVAERERDYLRSECDRLREVVRTGGPPSLDGGQAAVVQEIEEEIKMRGDIDGARHRAFTVAPQFAPILEAHGARYRPKVIKACADVVLGAPALLGRREDHVLRTGDGANDAVRTRARDGAEARRCCVEQGTPGARRLHYWVTPEGAVEFASVNVHDDMNIPD